MRWVLEWADILLWRIRQKNRMAGHDRKKDRYRVAKIKGRQ